MRALQTILFFLIIVSLVSCEKVIDVEIREADRKYVIEGVVTNEGLCEVRLSRSVHFNDPSVFPDISGAQVIVYDNGVPHVLPEILPGLYRTGTVPGTPGHAYDLFVKIGDEVFTARCNMLAPVPSGPPTALL